jgi:hypothetical protein
VRRPASCAAPVALGRRRLHPPTPQVVTLASLAALMNVSQRLGWGLAGVWWGIVWFFSVRFVQSVTRLAWLRRQQQAQQAAAAGE